MYEVAAVPLSRMTTEIFSRLSHFVKVGFICGRVGYATVFHIDRLYTFSSIALDGNRVTSLWTDSDVDIDTSKFSSVDFFLRGAMLRAMI